MRDHDLIRILRIEARVLEHWVAEGWIRPTGDDEGYSDADLARARLILDLSGSLGVNEAGIDVAMRLIDQLHGMRVVMRHLVESTNRADRRPPRRIFPDIVDLD
jgi:chaperone modulatory protein CbpM